MSDILERRHIAESAANRLIARAFKRTGLPAPIFSIPAKETDDDVALTAWIRDAADEIARKRAIEDELAGAGLSLIKTICSGTVYEGGEPSYHNGSMGALFKAIQDLEEAIDRRSGPGR